MSTIVIRSMNELSQQIRKGNIFPVVSSLDSIAIYFKKDNGHLEEIAGKEVSAPGDYLLHSCETRRELLENIQDYNKGKERAEAFSADHVRKLIGEVNFHFPIVIS